MLFIFAKESLWGKSRKSNAGKNMYTTVYSNIIKFCTYMDGDHLRKACMDDSQKGQAI